MLFENSAKCYHIVFILNYVGGAGLNRSLSPDLQACAGWDTCPALLAPVVSSLKVFYWILHGFSKVQGAK